MNILNKDIFKGSVTQIAEKTKQATRQIAQQAKQATKEVVQEAQKGIQKVYQQVNQPKIHKHEWKKVDSSYAKCKMCGCLCFLGSGDKCPTYSNKDDKNNENCKQEQTGGKKKKSKKSKKIKKTKKSKKMKKIKSRK